MKGFEELRKLHKQLIVKLMKIFHFIVTISIFALWWYCFYISKYSSPYNIILMLFYGVIYILLGYTYKAYDLGYSRITEMVYSHVMTCCICGCFTYIACCLLAIQMVNPMPIIVILIIQMMWHTIWAMGANKIYFNLHPPKRTVMVYRNSMDLGRLKSVRNFDYKFAVEKYVENPQDYDELLRQIEGFEVIFVTGINATLRNGIAKYCVENGVSGYFTPHVGDIILSGAIHTHAFGVPVQEVARKSISLEYRFVKRWFDIVSALTALVLLSPIMLIIALLIKLCDGGPVFYRQTRVTYNGKLFSILKFRSMRVDAEKDGVARLASENDNRITNVGRFIRASRIDELPQLINILCGDMSIVGPRPERPEIVVEYEKLLPAFRLRLQVKAGLTGYAQVYGRYNTEPYDKLQMDLIYINRMSFVEDLKLIFATIKILFLKESTQGVADGHITALDIIDEKKSA